MMKTFFSIKKGFTLIEIVMVIVIIGVLATILVPRFSAQKDMSEIASTRANLENLRAALALYYAREAQWPPSPKLLSDLWDGTSPSTTIYLSAIPKELVSGMPSGNIVSATFSGTGGWVYDMTDPNNPTIMLNVNDVTGDPQRQYSQW